MSVLHKTIYGPLAGPVFRRLLPMLCARAPMAGAGAAVLAAGPGKTYATPCAAFAAARSGDIVEIEGAYTYSGNVCYVGVSNLTIRGVRGRPKIDAAGKSAGGKAVWVVSGSNVVVENVEIYGAKVPDRNGAAFRIEGTNFTLRNSFIHDNENGILCGANANSNIVLENNDFGHNGDGSGQTHNVYIGAIASLVFRYNYSHDAVIGHNLKSRALVNTVIYNRFSTLAPTERGSTAGGRPSYEIDLPNGGTAYVIGNVIQQPAAYENSTLLAYGGEGSSGTADALYIVNNTFLNDGANGIFINVNPRITKPAHIQNNLFAGRGTLTTQAAATLQTNYKADQVGFVNRAAYDLHPLTNPQITGAGSEPIVPPTGVALRPVMEYQHTASGSPRPVADKLDIGAYQSGVVGVTVLDAGTRKP
jgi:hypothetical protein